MPDWSSYFARIEGAPISIAVDLAFNERAPLAEKPTAYTVALALLRPDEHGMTSPAEYRTLQAIEEELAAALGSQGILEVGRVTGRGMRTFHYYGPPERDLAPVIEPVMGMHAEYRYRALAAADPAWGIYTGYLYPDGEQLAFANDMKAMQSLIDAGDDLELPRPIEHTISFADAQQAAMFADAVAGHGYQIASNGAKLVRCSKIDPVDPFKITEMRTALTTLAQEFGGEYAGWSTDVQGG